MRTCPNCNQSLEDEALFCDSCGMKLPEEIKWEPEAAEFIFCTNCGTKCAATSAFCDNCGNSLAENPNLAAAGETPAYSNAITPNSAPVQPVQQSPAAQPIPPSYVPQQPVPLSPAVPKRTGGKKVPLIGGIIAAAVIIFCIVNFIILPGMPKKAAVYLKDYELFYTDFSGKPVQITKSLLPREYKENGSGLSGFIHDNSKLISKDGKKIVYPDNISEKRYTADIYFRDMKNADAEPVKITKAADLGALRINDEGDLVTYVEGTNGESELYQYDVKSDEKNRVGSDISPYRISISEDGNTIYFFTEKYNKTGNYEGNDLYIKEKGKDKEKVDIDVTNIRITEDYSTVYYIKENNLYKKQIGSEKIKIASDVSYLINAYDNGGVYYVKNTMSEHSLSEYINNDMEGEDAKELLKEKIKLYEYFAYYYDGSNETLLGKVRNSYTEDLYMEGISYNYAAKNPVAVFNVSSDEEQKVKLDLSAMTDGYINDSEEVKGNIVNVLSSMESSYECSVFEGSTLKGILPENISNAIINDDGSILYFFEEQNEKGYGDLYEAKASEKYKPQLKDSDVYNILLVTNDGAFYSKDRSDDSYFVFKDKEKIDEVSSSFNPEGSAFTYVKDGDIYLYSNGEKQKLGTAGDEIFVSSGVSSNDFLYIADYSRRYKSGELYRYNSGKTEKLDSDANYIVDTNFNKK